MNKSLLS